MHLTAGQLGPAGDRQSIYASLGVPTDPHTPQLTFTVPQTSQLTSTVPQTSQLTSTVPQTSQLDSTVPHTSQLTSTVPHTSQLTSTVPHMLQLTSTVPHMSQLTSTVPHTSQLTSTVPQTSQLTSTVPHTSQLTSTVPHTSQLTSTVPHTSQLDSTVSHTSQLTSTVPHTSQMTSMNPQTSQVDSRASHTLQLTSAVPRTSQLTSTVSHTSQLTSAVPHTSQLTSTVPHTSQLTSAVPRTSQLTSTVPHTSQLGSKVPRTPQLAYDSKFKSTTNFFLPMSTSSPSLNNFENVFENASENLFPSIRNFQFLPSHNISTLPNNYYSTVSYDLPQSVPHLNGTLEKSVKKNIADRRIPAQSEKEKTLPLRSGARGGGFESTVRSGNFPWEQGSGAHNQASSPIIYEVVPVLQASGNQVQPHLQRYHYRLQPTSMPERVQIAGMPQSYQNRFNSTSVFLPISNTDTQGDVSDGLRTTDIRRNESPSSDYGYTHLQGSEVGFSQFELPLIMLGDSNVSMNYENNGYLSSERDSSAFSNGNSTHVAKFPFSFLRRIGNEHVVRQVEIPSYNAFPNQNEDWKPTPVHATGKAVEESRQTVRQSRKWKDRNEPTSLGPENTRTRFVGNQKNYTRDQNALRDHGRRLCALVYKSWHAPHQDEHAEDEEDEGQRPPQRLPPVLLASFKFLAFDAPLPPSRNWWQHIIGTPACLWQGLFLARRGLPRSLVFAVLNKSVDDKTRLNVDIQ
ncbi:hypothetical protein FHG87_000706 [Trinorchestia longiramus]|nr:hypothetical protein FHG87_000706 [Trinorchestia longiramus]